MKRKKNLGGRPRTVNAALRLTVWLDEKSALRVKKLSSESNCSMAEVVRRLLSQ